MDEQGTFWEVSSQLFWLYPHSRALILSPSQYATYLSSLELVFVSFKLRKRKLEEQLAAPK